MKSLLKKLVVMSLGVLSCASLKVGAVPPEGWQGALDKLREIHSEIVNSDNPIIWNRKIKKLPANFFTVELPEELKNNSIAKLLPCLNWDRDELSVASFDCEKAKDGPILTNAQDAIVRGSYSKWGNCCPRAVVFLSGIPSEYYVEQAKKSSHYPVLWSMSPEMVSKLSKEYPDWDWTTDSPYNVYFLEYKLGEDGHYHVVDNA